VNIPNDAVRAAAAALEVAPITQDESTPNRIAAGGTLDDAAAQKVRNFFGRTPRPSAADQAARSEKWLAWELMGGDTMAEAAKPSPAAPATVPPVTSPVAAAAAASLDVERLGLIDAHTAHQKAFSAAEYFPPDGITRGGSFPVGDAWIVTDAAQSWLVIEDQAGRYRGLGPIAADIDPTKLARVMAMVDGSAGVALTDATMDRSSFAMVQAAAVFAERRQALPERRSTPEPVQAAATPTGPFPALNGALSDLTGVWEQITRTVWPKIDSAAELGLLSALERVGRLKKAEAEPGAVQAEAAAWAVAAAAVELRPGKIDGSIDGPINNATDHTRRILTDGINQVIDAAEERFGVTYDPETVMDMTANAQVAVDEFSRLLRELVQDRLGSGHDGTDQTLIAPAGLTRHVVALAGGAELDPDGFVNRDSAGFPVSGGVTGTDCLGCGPIGQRLISEAIAAHSNVTPAPVQAVATRTPGIQISDRLRADLEEIGRLVAESPDVETVDDLRVVKSTWQLNMNGVALENLQVHIDGAGTSFIHDGTVTDIDDPIMRNVLPINSEPWPRGDVHHPGAHYMCRCGWRNQTAFITPDADPNEVF